MAKINLGNVKEWGWMVLPIGVLVVIRLTLVILRARGVTGVTLDELLSNLWIVSGWVLGWIFVNAEQTKWVVANWSITKYGPIRNVLVCAVVAALGIWVTSSSASTLAAGFVWGVGVRLFSEMVKAQDLSKWFAIIARPFTVKEQRVFVLAFGIALGICGWMLIGY